jgi:hypothetical protein
LYYLPPADLIDDGLAREPGERITMKVMRARLQEIAQERLADASWPIRP